MPKFSAESLSAVEYDFTGFEDADHPSGTGHYVDDKGSVPEPSRALVGQTMKKISESFKKFGFDNVEDNSDSIRQAMQEVDQELLYGEMSDYILEAMAELCGGVKNEETGEWTGGKPAYDTLRRLGNRAFMGFFNYLMSEMMSPEVSKPATNNSQRHLRSV